MAVEIRMPVRPYARNTDTRRLPNPARSPLGANHRASWPVTVLTVLTVLSYPPPPFELSCSPSLASPVRNQMLLTLTSFLSKLFFPPFSLLSLCLLTLLPRPVLVVVAVSLPLPLLLSLSLSFVVLIVVVCRDYPLLPPVASLISLFKRGPNSSC